MTVAVGRTQIHLGWPTAGAIVLSLIVSTWGAAQFFAGFMNSQREMQKQLSIIAGRDSIYYSKTEQNTADIISLKYQKDSLKADFNLLKLALSRGRQLAFYTEKKINGQIILSK